MARSHHDRRWPSRVRSTTGTGNTAIAAAAAGADVSAFDITPRLLDVARERAAAAGLTIDFREGDLLAIPYPDDAFDLVLSTFGAFTADDPPACARELVCVCRPDGTIVTTAWADEGVFGVLTEVAVTRYPALVPHGAADPRAWADEAGLAGIFSTWSDAPRRSRSPRPRRPSRFEATSGPVQRMPPVPRRRSPTAGRRPAGRSSPVGTRSPDRRLSVSNCLRPTASRPSHRLELVTRIDLGDGELLVVPPQRSTARGARPVLAAGHATLRLWVRLRSSGCAPRSRCMVMAWR